VTVREQVRYWGLALLVLILLIWLLRAVLLPFVAGIAVAYFLDPLVDHLERRGMARWAATTLVLLAFGLALIAIVLLLVPLLHHQILGLAERLPGYLAALRQTAQPLLADLFARLQLDAVQDARDVVSGIANQALDVVAGLLRQAWSGGVALFNLLSLLVVTPVVAFYMLRDFDAMVAKVDGWLPRQHAPTIRRLVGEIDSVMAGFVRGQGTVCLLLGAFYAVALTLVGLEFGLIIGILSGLISFVPFVGAVVGLALSLLAALTQFLPEAEYLRIVAVIIVFVVGQTVEGNFLTPRLLGSHIGLHPVWIMFALFAGGALFGFVGVLIAVPAAAMIGVLVRFAVQRYLDSRLFETPGTD